MKLHPTILTAVAAATALCAQAQIAQWTFETSVPATAGPFAPEVGAGEASGSHAGAAVYSNPAGNGSVESFSSNTWAPGDYYQFKVATTGTVAPYLNLSWDQTSSSTGPKAFSLQYSTDGTTFTPLKSYTVLQNGLTPNASWNSTTAVPAYSVSADTSGVSGGGLVGFANVYFRLVDAEGAASAVAGTDRVDNFTVSFAPVPEPEEYAAMFAGGLLAFAVVRRHLARSK